MKKKSGIRIFFLTLFILVAAYLFWGPLFPWNPLKIGFEKIESSKATVYITEYDGESIVYRINELLLEVEDFHGIKFQDKFKIIILGKESNMKRFLPWLSGTGYSVKLGFLNVIYIGSTARNSPYGIEVYLKHEISHLLIHQNALSSENNFEIQKQGWLAEGVATYFGGPHFYAKEEFVRLWTDKGLTFNNLYEENPLAMNKSFVLKYTFYRFFIEFLIDTYGLGNFQSYLKKYIETPKIYKHLFADVYDAELNEILAKFSSYMNQK